MNSTDTDRVFNELPCLACDHWGADRVRTQIGAAYLICERGETPKIPPRAELMRYCCKTLLAHGGVPEDSITFIQLGQVGKI
jgi:hypothetical protein